MTIRSPATYVALPTWANGPDGTGNGGFTAGVCAALLPGARGGADHAVTVTLRMPPPLGRPLATSIEARRAVLLDPDADGATVSEAAPGDLDRFVPDVVREIGAERARAASVHFGFRDRHPFPGCLVCGIDRPVGVPSLELHCGTGYTLTGGVQVYFDAFDVEQDVLDRIAADVDCDALGTSPGRILAWAALDCPSAAPFADPDGPAIVLGRITARILRDPEPGETLVAGAWSRGVDGRKYASSSALADAAGGIVAVADATWIALG